MKGSRFIRLMRLLVFFSTWGLFAAGAAAQEIKIIIIKPITDQKILPGSLEAAVQSVATPDQTAIRVRACRGEFEPASFVIRPSNLLSDLLIETTDLVAASGARIPRAEIDIRIVKCWYQAGTTRNKTGKLLVPELLLKDENLVKVDEVTQTNYLRVTLEGQTTLVDVSSETATFPTLATFQDAALLQPFSVPAGTNKQIWITLHVPANTAGDEYKGALYLKHGNQRLKTIPVVLHVSPFDLPAPMVDYGLYYRGRLSKGPVTEVTSEGKSPEQYTRELQNMKNHGVFYPVLYQIFNEMLGPALEIRRALGLPTDNLYALRVTTANMVRFDEEEIAALVQDIVRWKDMASQYGYRTLFIYGKDEAKGDALVAQRPAWEAAHAAGVKVFVAGYIGAVDLVGDLLDLVILSGGRVGYQPEEVAKWHQHGKKVFLYSYPQVGIEDPEIYRRNYGFGLVCNGYDGVMNYAYQHVFGGHIWNDFDHFGEKQSFRDHVFAYPTSDGLVDTVEWEGFREAVDDVRYYSALFENAGPGVQPTVCGWAAAGEDPDDIRAKIATAILDPDLGEPDSLIPIPKKLRKQSRRRDIRDGHGSPLKPLPVKGTIP